MNGETGHGVLKQFSKNKIVCFSTADWDTLLPTNKHQLMTRFAKMQNRVLFIETLGTRKPRATSSTDIRRIFNRFSRGFEGPVKRRKNLYTLSPIVSPDWSSKPRITLNRKIFKLQLGRTLQQYRQSIVWCYNPYAVYLLDYFRPEKIVYHMVDDLAEVPGADKLALKEAEAQLLAKADMVFCTERSLYDRAKRITDSCMHLPNVADFRHFSRINSELKTTLLARLEALPRPRIVFSGNLAPHKVDFDLLLKVAQSRPEWNLVLMGPLWEGSEVPRSVQRLKEKRNVILTGHIPYRDLPTYLHTGDVLVIPYLLNDVTRAVSPLKLFEYLGTGKPVVSTPLPSVLPYGAAISVAEGPDEWIRSIEQSLVHNHRLELQRRALAKRHTWERRIHEMTEALRD